jgi:succinyl-diaminopimelate desuccinylase
MAWIMCHLDVVPPGEQQEDGSWAGWDSDPFEVRRHGDRIYGRGVEDNQQALVAGVFAARALRENGLRPPRSVALLFVSDEETGSEKGLGFVLRERPELFSRQDVIIVPDAGNPDGSMIEIAEKSVLWLQLRTEGKQAHGSMPDKGCNAFRAAARQVCALDDALARRFRATDPLYDPPRSTFEPTRHAGNVPNVNTIPGEEVFSFDCRVLPRFDLDEVLECVREEIRRVDAEVGTRTKLDVLNRLDAPEPTPPDVPAVRAIRAAVQDVYRVPAQTMGVGGSTVAAMFRRQGYPAVVWSKIDCSAHQANEYCHIRNMVGDATVFAHLFLQEW